MADVDYPTVLNPAAIGDPDIEPVVQLDPSWVELIRLPPRRDA